MTSCYSSVTVGERQLATGNWLPGNYHQHQINHINCAEISDSSPDSRIPDWRTPMILQTTSSPTSSHPVRNGGPDAARQCVCSLYHIYWLPPSHHQITSIVKCPPNRPIKPPLPLPPPTETKQDAGIICGFSNLFFLPSGLCMIDCRVSTDSPALALVEASTLFFYFIVTCISLFFQIHCCSSSLFSMLYILSFFVHLTISKYVNNHFNSLNPHSPSAGHPPFF